MYRPVRDGIEKSVRSVIYSEAYPPERLRNLVHCFWELRTQTDLDVDFHYHVLPDACVNILLDRLNIQIAAVTALNLKAKVLNLGRRFHFMGAQLLPGVWRGNPRETKNDLVDKPYSGTLPLIDFNQSLNGLDFIQCQERLAQLIEYFAREGLVTENALTSAILRNLDDIRTVTDMTSVTGLSARQLQRFIKKQTGFSPHDLLKILRLHQSFAQDYHVYYADQSHFIHSFSKITGYTPKAYLKKFDV